MAVVQRDIELWFICDTEDTTFHSIPFRSEEEANKAIEEIGLFTTHESVSVIIPVKYDEDAMDVHAREWVSENLGDISPAGWTKTEFWDYISEFHVGGKDGFIILSPM